MELPRSPICTSYLILIPKRRFWLSIQGIVLPMILIMTGLSLSQPALVEAAGELELFAAGLTGPFGMAFDASGNLFVANEGNGGGGTTVSEITPLGTVSAFATGFNGPAGVAFNSNEELFISDDTGRVFRVSDTGVVDVFISGVGLSNPNAIAFDVDDNLYVLSAGGFVSKFDANGALVNLQLASGFSVPQGIVVDDSAGMLYISDAGGNIFQVDKNSGSSILFVATNAASNGGLTADNSGNLYMSTGGSGLVYRVGLLDQSISICLSGLDFSRGVVFDSIGRLYVTSYYTGEIYRADTCQNIIISTISGTITAADTGQPLVDAEVLVHTFDTHEFRGSFRTASNGSYVTAGLASGEYQLLALATGYAREFYEEGRTDPEAIPVVVVEGEDTSGIDFTLDLAGTITGKVTGENGAPLQNMGVDIENGGLGTCTDGSGNFNLELPAGDFKIAAGRDFCGGADPNYVEEYWAGFGNDGTFNRDDAVPINVVPGNTIANINFVLQLGGTVSGRVIDQVTGNPIENMVVSVSLDGFGIGTCTNGNGDYTVEGVPLDTYFRVNAASSNNFCGGPTNYIEEFWEEIPNFNDATLLSLTSGSSDMTGIDFTLVVGGTVSGRVIDQVTGAPIENMVAGVSLDGFGIGTCTNANGEFTVSGLPLDTPIRVNASGGFNFCGGPTNYIQEFWQETVDFNAATLITLTSGSSDVTDIDFTLEVGGSVSGRVIDQDSGNPIENMVAGVSLDGFGIGTCTNANGEFTVSGLPFDTPIRVNASGGFNFCGGPTNYVEEFWHETPNSNAATLITLTSGSSDATGIDFTLEVGGTVSGTVIDQVTGQSIANLNVNADFDGFGIGTCTDADGNYAFVVPLDTPISLHAAFGFNFCGGPTNYIEEFWHETPNSNAATLITLTSGSSDATGIDFTLDVGGTVSGRVIDQVTGAPIENMVAGVSLDGFGIGTCTDANGEFIVTGLPLDTPIRVNASGGFNFCGGPTNYALEFWHETPNFNDATVITLTSGNSDATGIDFTLEVLTAEQAIDEIIDDVEDLDPGDFSKPNRKGAFLNKLEAVLDQVQAGDLDSICEAIDKLTNDILPKTEGEEPPPDWVTNSVAQQELEDQINIILSALQIDAGNLGGCP